mgnify:CR=1 FL=1
MKKYFIVAICTILSVSMITGCGSKKEEKKEDNKTEISEEENNNNENTDDVQPEKELVIETPEDYCAKVPAAKDAELLQLCLEKQTMAMSTNDYVFYTIDEYYDAFNDGGIYSDRPQKSFKNNTEENIGKYNNMFIVALASGPSTIMYNEIPDTELLMFLIRYYDLGYDWYSKNILYDAYEGLFGIRDNERVDKVIDTQFNNSIYNISTNNFVKISGGFGGVGPDSTLVSKDDNNTYAVFTFEVKPSSNDDKYLVTIEYAKENGKYYFRKRTSVQI